MKDLIDSIYLGAGLGELKQILIVAKRTGPDEDQWKCYSGIVDGWSWDSDHLDVMRMGGKVPQEIAVRLFPDLDANKFVN